MNKILGVVKKNKGRGRQLGYPTANLDVESDLEEGVYLGVVTMISGQLPPLLRRNLLARKSLLNGGKGIKGDKGAGLPALVFIGIAETFGEIKKQVEVYILDFNMDIYGTNLEVEVIKKIRDNQKFDSIEDLIDQMKNDELVARQFFASYNRIIK